MNYNYTEADLHGKTKNVLVPLILKIQSRLSSIQSGPLTPGAVKQRVLDLKMRAAEVKDNAIAREQAHNERMAAMINKHSIETQELQLQFNWSQGKEAAVLIADFKEVEEAVKIANKDLSYGLQKAEAETRIAIEEVELTIGENIEKLNTAHAIAVSKLQKSTDEINAETANKIAKNSRDFEQMDYDHDIAIRNQSLEVANKLAKHYKMSIIDTDDLSALVDFKAADTTVIKATVGKEVGIATSKIAREENAKFDKLKSETDNAINLLNNDKTHLSNQLSSYSTRIQDLEIQVKEFPKQLAVAVEAANAPVTIHQDAAKK